MVEYFNYKDKMIIYNDDILSIDLPDSFVDLTITSPPYGLDIRYDKHNDNIPYGEYLEFTRRWLEKCYRLSKPDGRFCLNIPLDKNKGERQSVYADIITIVKEVGWKYYSTIIWNKQNISRRTAWGSWMSASAPCVIAPVEMIAILYKNQWDKQDKTKQSDISRDEFIKWTNGLWTFPGESRRVGHPAPFPLELPKRCIKLFTHVGDTVFDPFLGSGTTLIATSQLNRIGIGVEVSEEYCKLAKKRLISEGGLFQNKLEIAYEY